MTEQTVKAKVFKADLSNRTKQIHEDDFMGSYGGDIVEPPYNLKELKSIGGYSSILQQCVDAYKTNIVEFGIEPEFKVDINAEDIEEGLKVEAENEWQRLDEFIRYLNMDESAESVIGHMIDDREKTGNGYFEIIRNGKDEPAGIEYVDAQHIRICRRTVPEQVEYTILENGVPTTVKRWKKFRKYVQMIDGKKVYFKEYGDPRTLNSQTGKFDDNTPDNLVATEIYHFKIGSETYGIPRWIGTLISLYGARKAEELNMMYFQNGRHIPAAITVSNGKLDDDSYKQLQEYMDDLQGPENAHKFLLLEAMGNSVEGKMGEEEVTPAKVEIQSLAEVLQKDALFLEYDEKTRKKLRSAFRLPPLYTGESEDFSRASADTARKVTEEQVFQPQRKGLARALNMLFLEPLGFNHVRLAVKGADFRDPIEIAKALYPLITGGAVAPNDLRELAGQVLGERLDPLDEEYNIPFQMLLKNNEQANDPNDPFGDMLDLEKSRNKKNQEVDIVNLLKDMRDVLEEMK